MQPNKAQSPEMFNKIARRYDLVNRILSFGIDIAWRRKVVNMAEREAPKRVLDIATGTGDLLIALAEGLSSDHLVGLDPSEGMLEYAKKKISKHQLSDRIELVKGDALALPFTDNDFDLVTIAFGIRNVPDVDQALSEMHRVLKPGGKLLVLEFSMPKNRFIRFVHLFYLRHILPTVGGLISGNKQAYKYLNATIETFPFGVAFMAHMERAGFSQVRAATKTFGVATIYEGFKV